MSVKAKIPVRLAYFIWALLATQLSWAATGPVVWRDTIKKAAPAGDDKEISTLITSADKNSIFDDVAKYGFEVKNPTENNQQGKISYILTNENGEKLKTDSLNISVAKKSTARYNFDIPGKGVGFYSVKFMINTSDYDDTIHKVFGIKPQQITSAYKKPADFDAFWQAAKDELATVKPRFTTILMPKLSTANRNVYLVEMQSIGNVTVRGWLTEPNIPNKKFAIILGLPGYQIDLPPVFGTDKDVAFLTLNVRGQGNSRTTINTRREEYIVYHIEDKNKYVMRGVVMDCLRAVDYICSRPELKHDNIFVKGGSMGGFLAIATASLDKRVNLCSAQSPIFADMRSLVTRVNFPIASIKRYISIQPGLTQDKILDNLDYFDAKNFATNVNCKLLMSIGLLDTYVPPTNDYVVFNSIKSSKRISIFKDLGHEASPKYIELELAWMHDEFGLY